MPIVNADVKGLEFRTAVWYGQDKTGLHEIDTGVEIHSRNMEDFRLPERVVAKRFVFKLIFGGSAFGMAVDPEFAHLKYSEKKWAEFIDSFYEKYAGIRRWHASILEEAKRTGKLMSASGRVYHFEPQKTRWGVKWPEPKIKNYPVQGLGADIVALLRIAVFRRLYPKRDDGILLINTVHDSIMVDCKSEHVDYVCKTINDVTNDLPATISRCFNVQWDVPMAVEIGVGPNYKELKEYAFPGD